MTLPGGGSKQFDYDPLMRIKDITAKDPGQNNMMHYEYAYDNVDNIVSKNTEHGDYAYEYDNLYRLNTVDNPDFDDEAFTYDAVGNRLTSEDTTGDWAYNDNNELGGYDDVSYEYDVNGNMTQKTVGGVVTKFFYNIEDRLSEVRDGSDNLIASYYYDPFGRRLWKEVSGVRTYFFYADEGLIGEYDSTGAEKKTYGYKPNSTWTTDPLFMKVGTDYYFYQNDHLGTPQKMTAVNGAVVWSAKYSSFGEANVEVESVENNLRFPGQYADVETGLRYNWWRYYDPKLGRYLKFDPAMTNQPQKEKINNLINSILSSVKGLRSYGYVPHLEGINVPYLITYLLSTPIKLNGYSYTSNNPINLSDSLGLRDEDECFRKTALFLKAVIAAEITCWVPEPAQPIACAVAVLAAVYAAHEMDKACECSKK